MGEYNLSTFLLVKFMYWILKCVTHFEHEAGREISHVFNWMYISNLKIHF
jgi:hypothetical protein